jgi:hypothetical protein
MRPRASANTEQDLKNEAERKADAKIESKIGAKPIDPEAQRLTNELKERRDEVKYLLGDKYAYRIAQAVPIIQKEMTDSGHSSPIKAVVALSNKMDFEAIEGSILLACAADMIEGKVKPIDPTQGQAVAFGMGKKSYNEDGGMSDDGDEDEEECAMEGDTATQYATLHDLLYDINYGDIPLYQIEDMVDAAISMDLGDFQGWCDQNHPDLTDEQAEQIHSWAAADVANNFEGDDDEIDELHSSNSQEQMRESLEASGESSPMDAHLRI